MKRRAFVAGMAVVAVTADAAGQHIGKTARIAWLGDTFPGSASPGLLELFKTGLRATGYVVGENAVLELRSPAGDPERLPGLAIEVMKGKVDVILAVSELAVQAARAAAKGVPIVFTLVDDPVTSGLVQSMARPGGNITGVSWMYGDYAAKFFDLLQEAMPRLSRVALLVLQASGRVRLSPAIELLNAAALAHRATLQISEIGLHRQTRYCIR